MLHSRERLGPYEILEQVGAGGIGEAALDSLDRYLGPVQRQQEQL
jgi:hypothetical protein